MEIIYCSTSNHTNAFTNWDLLSIIVASLALIIGIIAIRYQIKGVIYAQMSEKAKECNSYLDVKDLTQIPRSEVNISGIVSSIITSKEIMDFLIKRNFLLIIKRCDKEAFLEIFYLQLHTTIRKFLESESILIHFKDQNNTYSTEFSELVQKQFLYVRKILIKSITKKPRTTY